MDLIALQDGKQFAFSIYVKDDGVQEVEDLRKRMIPLQITISYDYGGAWITGRLIVAHPESANTLAKLCQIEREHRLL